ncbi:hypothetical protein HID58_002360 [Brassica napus]|uniref:Uncharacterized protein n=1 Tax=Brassica napus TaxID=3708 RepID=A0ABQ8EML0_BRANA|nr:hypothetical protein HID58_002360 [Brassica napus]
MGETSPLPPFDTVSDFRAGEVPVYEGFFESGFRDQVPSLIAEVFESGFSSTWRTADISRADVSSGRHVIEQLLGLPVDHCEISFLVSEEALDQCSIRGMISDPRDAEALEDYKKALEVMAARKAAIHRVVPAGGSNIQFT